MYTLNVIVLDEAVFPLDRLLKSHLENLPQLTYKIYSTDFFLEKSSSFSTINLFLCSKKLTHELRIYQQLRTFLTTTDSATNICMIPDGENLDNDLVAQFHDFLLWPCSVDEFRTRIERPLLSKTQSTTDYSHLLAEFSSLNLIGESPLFVQNVQLIKKMSTCHAAVLIQGETGTGKENAARAIHYLSKRREQSFVPVNCAAIPDNLIESELFGHEKGAFTDAKQAQAGLVTIANGGTLFLDEVDSLSAKGQAALLRFLQTHEYRPLGLKQTLRADVRVLAATNANLKELVSQKLFREDLYFRLNVLNLTMPPLRERLSDIPLLANSLLRRFALEHQTHPKRLSEQGLDHLKQQLWPGNIRELENCLLRAFLLSPNETLEFENEILLQPAEDQLSSNFQSPQNDISFTQSTNSPLSFQDAKEIAITQFEESYLALVMRIAEGNVSEAARISGKERRALGKLLQKHAIDKRQFQTSDCH